MTENVRPGWQASGERMGATIAEIAWAAGLYEGEGCATSYKNGRTTVTASLCVETTDEDVLRRFHEIVGCGTFYLLTPRRTKPSHHKRVWRWRCASLSDVKKVEELFRPWLGARRTEQITKTIQRVETSRQR